MEKNSKTIKTINVTPIMDRVIVKRKEEQHKETKTSSGIILPSGILANNSTYIEGEVIEVGPGRYDNCGRRVIPDVKKGDKILFPKVAGVRLNVADGDGEFVIINDRDVVAVILEEE